MTEAERAMIDAITRVEAQQLALKEVLGSALAELAMTQTDPADYLQRVISSEEGAVYAAAAGQDDPTPTVTRILAIKAEFRGSLFGLARAALQRMLSTR